MSAAPATDVVMCVPRAKPFLVPKMIIWKLEDPETGAWFYNIELQRGDGTAEELAEVDTKEEVIGALAAFFWGGSG